MAGAKSRRTRKSIPGLRSTRKSQAGGLALPFTAKELAEARRVIAEKVRQREAGKIAAVSMNSNNLSKVNTSLFGSNTPPSRKLIAVPINNTGNVANMENSQAKIDKLKRMIATARNSSVKARLGREIARIKTKLKSGALVPVSTAPARNQPTRRATNANTPEQKLLNTFQSAPNIQTALHLSKNATRDQINKAYRRAALSYHPNKNPSPLAANIFRRISQLKEEYEDKAAAPNAIPAVGQPMNAIPAIENATRPATTNIVPV
jgi:hypothetical protein